MPEVQRIWKIGGYRALHPQPFAETAAQQGWPMLWHGKVNSVSCPRGRRYGEAHFLISQDTLDELDKTAALNITCEHENGTTTLAGYYVISTQAITKSTDKPAHWVTLADRRWILEKVACQRRFNLRKDASNWVTSTLNGGTPYTWQQVLQSLWSLLPSAAGSCPTLTSVPTSTPENLIFDGASAWRAINQVLSAIAHAAVLNPSTGAFKFVYLNGDQTGISTAELDEAYRSRLLWQFAPEELTTTNYPASVAVTYPKMPSVSTLDTGLFPAEPTTETLSLGQGGLTGTTFPVTDTMFSRTTNAADRTARTAEIALAVQGHFRQMAEPWGNVYSGIIEFLCGSEITEVTWTSDGQRGMRTVVKHAWDGAALDWPEVPEYSGQQGDVHYDYVLLTNWFGGIALAQKRTMDQADLGEIVIIRDPRGIFDFQRAGDGGIMFYQPATDRYYAVQADCDTMPVAPVDPVGACCYQSSDGYDCFDATNADCTEFGGTWKGSGTSCAVDGCP